MRKVEEIEFIWLAKSYYYIIMWVHMSMYVLVLKTFMKKNTIGIETVIICFF